MCEGIGSVLGGLSAGWLLRSVGEVRMTGIGVALFAFADAFLARGWEVFEILSEKAARPHVLPGFARREGDRVIYDRPPQGDLALR